MKAQCLKRLAITASVVVTLLCPIGANAAVDMFLKLDGIKGESADKVHRDEIDVLSWSWGESAGTARTRRGLAPTACIQDIVVTKFIDAATPALIMNAVTGQVIPTGTLTLRKGGERPLEFLVLTMTNITISAYQTGGSGGEDRLIEQVTMNFERMVGSYRKQRPDGSADEAIVWDISSRNSRGCQ